jgi:hypothetical protein
MAAVRSGFGDQPEFSDQTMLTQACKPFVLQKKEWTSVEHYFQAQKYAEQPKVSEDIRLQKTAVEAKVRALYLVERASTNHLSHFLVHGNNSAATATGARMRLRLTCERGTSVAFKL